MFGKPDWFRKQEGRLRVRPASWKGWLYRGGWISAIGLPTLLLLGAEKGPEALIWLAASGGLFAWDWHQIKRGVGKPADDVLYIGDDEPTQLATEHFRLFRKA